MLAKLFQTIDRHIGNETKEKQGKILNTKYKHTIKNIKMSNARKYRNTKF